MSFTNLPYDRCAYIQMLRESTDPLKYQLYEGKFVNCDRCNKPPQLYSGQYETCGSSSCYYDQNSLLRVDVESDLQGRDRLASQCNSHKYHPKCTNPTNCVSKNDPRVPSFSSPFLCDIRPTNASTATNIGYNLPAYNVCEAKKKLK